MLFRPLLERRFFGLRVPFTPGILPRERKRLARSLGETVAVDLLDPKTVSDRLRSPVFAEAIRKAALTTGRRVLDAKPGAMLANIDAASFPALKDAALKVLAGVFASESFRRSLERGVDDAVSKAMDTPLSELVDPGLFPRLLEASGEHVVADGVSRALSIGIMGMIEKVSSSGKCLSDFMDKETLELLVGRTVETLYPDATAGILKMLGDKDVTAVMEKTGAQIMRKAIDRMNAIQRFFIGLGQYDRAILESMPETIADLRSSVRDTLSNPATKTGIIERAKRAAVALSEKPLSTFFKAPDQAGRDSSIAALSGALKNFLSKVGRESLAELTRTMVAGGTVGDVLRVFPEMKDKAGPLVASWAAGLLRNDERKPSAIHSISSAFLGSFFREFARLGASVPLGDTLRVDDDTLRIVATAAAKGLTELAAAESPTMLDSIDIRSLVVDKIDSLDMIEVERMLLRVIDKELGAITAFGGVLGAIIGMAQSVLLLLR
jgi:uncharacterized membrane protein YheB (UPF0754 family)